MFTQYSLPIDRFLPAPTRWRRLTALLVAAFAASALALGGGTSTASAAPSWVTFDTPYANDRVLGGRYIETSAYGSFGGEVESTLYQHWSGAWHQVAIASNTGDRAKAFVYCTKPYTPYWFATRARAWLRSPTGWRLAETRFSSNVVRYC